jgi:hypothetical protein
MGSRNLAPYQIALSSADIELQAGLVKLLLRTKRPGLVEPRPHYGNVPARGLLVILSFEIVRRLSRTLDSSLQVIGLARLTMPRPRKRDCQKEYPA